MDNPGSFSGWRHNSLDRWELRLAADTTWQLGYTFIQWVIYYHSSAQNHKTAMVFNYFVLKQLKEITEVNGSTSQRETLNFATESVQHLSDTSIISRILTHHTARKWPVCSKIQFCVKMSEGDVWQVDLISADTSASQPSMTTNISSAHPRGVFYN